MNINTIIRIKSKKKKKKPTDYLILIELYLEWRKASRITNREELFTTETNTRA